MFAIMVAAALLTVEQDERYVDLFESREYRYTGGCYLQEAFRYRLFVPRDMRPDKRYPLLLWLHGLGENGLDNRINLRYFDQIFRDVDHVEKYQFFVLAPQCPPANCHWYRRMGKPMADDMLTVAFEILQETAQEYSIDADRISLAGVSAGGSACWEMAMRYPDLFSAVAPFASGGGDLSRATKLIHLPIWTFHNSEDEATPIAGVQKMTAAINQAGGNVYLSVYQIKAHDSWSDAIKAGCIPWLLSQRRGAWVCWTPPGYPVWQWRDVVPLPTAYLAMILLAVAFERWRRRRKARHLASEMGWEVNTTLLGVPAKHGAPSKKIETITNA